MLEELMKELVDSLRDRSNGYVHRVEDTLSKLALLRDRRSIGLLLPFLDDNAEYDELMFSIVHTIEKFDDEVYVAEIIEHLATLSAQSPRWAMILHMRILNSPSALAAYEAKIGTLSRENRIVLKEILTSVGRKSAKFVPTCEKLLALSNA